MATTGEPSGFGGRVDRRTYLKLAGAATIGALGFVGTASAAPVEEIVVPAGATYKKVIQDGETFENKLIYITAPGASVRLIARGKGGWEVRNVGVRGSSTSADQNVITASAPAGSTGTIDNVYLGDGAVSVGQTGSSFPRPTRGR